MSNNQMPDKNTNQPPRPPQPPKMGRGLFGWVFVIAIVLLAFTLLKGYLPGSAQEMSYTEFWRHLQNNGFEGDLEVEQDKIRGELKESALPKKDAPKKFYVYIRPNEEEVIQQIREELEKVGSKTDLKVVPTSWLTGALPQLLLTIGLFVLVWIFLFRRLGGGMGGGGFLGNFARSKHRMMSKEQSKVTFDDVAGIEEAKDELHEIVQFLKNPKKFSRLGGRIPRGVLLVGEPGCGKTLLAKAIAGEADVPFFGISGSDFVEMFVGVGASRVRDLFKQAKENSPCIIFLDEIDAIGRRRGVDTGGGGGRDEREQTLNAILVEMDGFDSDAQVIVIAATNRGDILDPALTRPGRFDRQVVVPLPDLHGRARILQIYADKVKTSVDVDVHKLARGTPMFSGADLAALVNEAAIAAAMAEKDYVEQCDLEEARDKVRWGREKKSRKVDEQEREVTAYHEAGHALVQCLSEEADPLHKVSIIPRGQAGGATFSLPEKDRYLYTKRYCESLLQVFLGGRMAEEIFLGDISSGASNDITQATNIARRMVEDWGMSETLGFVRYGMDEGRGYFGFNKEHSDTTSQEIDIEVRAIINDARDKTRKTLEENRDTMHRLAAALIKYETLTAEEVQQIVDGKELGKTTVDDLLAVEQEKSTERFDFGDEEDELISDEELGLDAEEFEPTEAANLVSSPEELEGESSSTSPETGGKDTPESSSDTTA